MISPVMITILIIISYFSSSSVIIFERIDRISFIHNDQQVKEKREEEDEN